VSSPAPGAAWPSPTNSRRAPHVDGQLQRDALTKLVVIHPRLYRTAQAGGRLQLGLGTRSRGRVRVARKAHRYDEELQSAANADVGLRGSRPSRRNALPLGVRWIIWQEYLSPVTRSPHWPATEPALMLSCAHQNQEIEHARTVKTNSNHRSHRDQKVCSSRRCQSRGRTDYHRMKLSKDPHRALCEDSQKTWKQRNRNI
jgi:hypothetical protein